jgi:hypothetical protein
VVVIAGVLAGLASAALAASARSHQVTATVAGPTGPEGIPLQSGPPLAPESAQATGQPVDGIGCNANEQVNYHIHAHLTVYVNGLLRPIPAGVGLVSPVTQHTPDGAFLTATGCYYWLHVHSQDGIIHVESPTARTYTLGQFFAIWRQPLSADRVGPYRGKLSVFVNGRPSPVDPADLTLTSHEVIQIDVGTPVVPPRSVDWAEARL